LYFFSGRLAQSRYYNMDQNGSGCRNAVDCRFTEIARMPATKCGNPSVIGVPTYASRLRHAAITLPWKTAHHWKASIGFALLDQGMMSFANFAQLAIAARVLPIDEFGKYSIVWAMSLLVVSAVAALIVDPLPAIMSIRRPSMRIPILAAAVQLNLLVGCILAALILICGLIAQVWSPMFGMMLLCLAVASPLQQMQFASRRFCYLLRRQGVAAASAAAYATVLVGGVIGLWASTRCTASGLILLSGAASLAASAVGVAMGCLPVSKVRPLLRKWLIRQCWHSGKWLAGSSIAYWLSGASVYPSTAAILGPSASGIVRAQMTLLMPIYQFAWAIGFLLIPYMAEVGARQPASRLRAAAVLTIATVGAVTTAFSVVILVFGSDLLALIYNKPEITAASRLLWPIAIGAIVDAVTAAMAIVLIANAVTRFMFWARVASVAVFLAGALCLGPTIGLDGIVWALTTANVVCALIHVPALVRTLRRPSPTPLLQ
jgi:O-antigen/teichoic acid export membrane protein